ncbi:MAG TPA: hypothetical protein VGD69_30300 [Herpetosiphonaceae bacterium]
MGDRDQGFFAWQHAALGWLLAWGVASIVAGAGLATNRRQELRQIGLQSIVWGAIDAGLALSGRRGARKNQQRDPASAPRSGSQEAARFQRIVAINAGLDLLYIAGGLRLSQAARNDAGRYGTGLGITIQGAFLLLYDSLLTWLVAKWR